MANNKLYDDYSWFRVTDEAFKRMGFEYANDKWTEPNGEAVEAHHWFLSVTELIEIRISYAYKANAEFYEEVFLIIKDHATFSETHIEIKTKKPSEIAVLIKMLKQSAPTFYEGI